MIATKLRLLMVAVLLLIAGSSLTAAEPRTAEDRYQAGLKAKRLKDYDKAQVCFVTALLIDPDHYGASVEMAWIYNEKKDYDKAKVFAAKAIRVDPLEGDGWRELGYAEWKQGDPDEAEKSLRIAVRLNPLDKAAKQYLDAVLDDK